MTIAEAFDRFADHLEQIENPDFGTRFAIAAARDVANEVRDDDNSR